MSDGLRTIFWDGSTRREVPTGTLVHGSNMEEFETLVLGALMHMFAHALWFGPQVWGGLSVESDTRFSAARLTLESYGFHPYEFLNDVEGLTIKTHPVLRVAQVPFEEVLDRGSLTNEEGHIILRVPSGFVEALAHLTVSDIRYLWSQILSSDSIMTVMDYDVLTDVATVALDLPLGVCHLVDPGTKYKGLLNMSFPTILSPGGRKEGSLYDVTWRFPYYYIGEAVGRGALDRTCPRLFDSRDHDEYHPTMMHRPMAQLVGLAAAMTSMGAMEMPDLLAGVQDAFEQGDYSVLLSDDEE